MILSEKDTQVTLVALPSMSPVELLRVAGYAVGGTTIDGDAESMSEEISDYGIGRI